MKIIKKFLKILGITLLVVIVLAIVTPIIFQKQIAQRVKKEVNNEINATFDFEDYKLSLFRNFPNFSLRLDQTSIVGKDHFEGDTLADINSLFFTIDLMSVIKGDNYKIRKIHIDQPSINLFVTKDGIANWDIMKESEDTASVEEEEEEDAMKISLSKFSVSKANFTYNDTAGNMFIRINNMNHELKGDFTADVTDISTETSIDSMDFLYAGIPYMSKSRIHLKAAINADLKNGKYTLSSNELSINELFLSFNGWLALQEDEKISMDLSFEVMKTEFKNFLSLIPAVYAKDFEAIETSGTLGFKGFVKGDYYETHYPAFALNLSVTNAMFKYPDLPESVQNINIQAKTSKDEGSLDKTIISIPKLYFEMAQNPVDINMNILTPISDPDIKAAIKARINLADVGKFYPLEEHTHMNGTVDADLDIAGKLSTIEAEDYENFSAKGYVKIEKMEVKDPSIPQGMSIANAEMYASPQFFELKNFNASFGKSDLNASGKINNMMSFLFSDELLTGRFSTKSNYFNLNSFMQESETSDTENQEETSSGELSVIEVPANINFTLQSNFNKVLYGDLEMENVSGLIKIENQQVILENLSMNALDGKMIVSGLYSTINPMEPEVEFSLKIDGFNVGKTVKTFAMVEKLASVAEKTSGSFSTHIQYSSKLDQHMMPVLNTLNGNGVMQSSKLVIENYQPMVSLSERLKIDRFKRFSLQALKMAFQIRDGAIHIEPFDMNIDQTKAVFQGTTHLDKSINYVMNINIPKSQFGQKANDVLNTMINDAKAKGFSSDPGSNVEVDVIMTGTVLKPQIKIGLKGTMDETLTDLKDAAKDEINKQKEALETKAKEEAEKLKEEAEAKAKQEAEKLKEEAEKKKQEAEKKAKEEAEKQKESMKKKAEDELKKKIKKPF